MGLDILDIMFRLERRFGIKIERGEIHGLFEKNGPPDIMLGDLFDFVKFKSRYSGFLVLDEEVDADSFWPMFQHVISDSLGVEPEEVTKTKWLIQELGAG